MRNVLCFGKGWGSWENTRRKARVERTKSSAYAADLAHDKPARGEQVANRDAILWLAKEELLSEQIEIDPSHWSSWNDDGIVPSLILVRSRRKQDSRR